MAVYIDRYCILDTDYLVCAARADGEGPYDGRVFLSFLLDIGDCSKRLSAEYPDAKARDAALEALGTLMKGELEIETGEDSDGDDD